MAQIEDDGLAELIAREQRGFRQILFAGVATLMVMALTSAALGVYLYIASASLAQTTRTLQRHAFETRRSVDQQNNRIAAQEVALRRIYDEIRLAVGDAEVDASAQNIESTMQAAEAFLLTGRVPSLNDQRALAQFGPEGAGELPPALRSFMTGVAHIVGHEVRGETIPGNATQLPPNLTDALEAFQAARSDASLAGLASAGVAWVRFEDASSDRRTYSAQACAQVFDAVRASARDEASLGPQPLYWRAQCERKLGMVSALNDYARALQARSAIPMEGEEPDIAELTMTMNAFHGMGTTLIANATAPDDAPGVGEALAIAAEACGTGEAFRRTPRMALALACLSQAVQLRQLIGQTPNQLSGSGENMSFAHLRDGDYQAAYDNAVRIEATGLFPWNEVVRALTSVHVRPNTPEDRLKAGEVAADSRANLALFTVGQFNLCELQALFDPAMYDEARAIIATELGVDEVACEPAA